MGLCPAGGRQGKGVRGDPTVRSWKPPLSKSATDETSSYGKVRRGRESVTGDSSG